MIKKKPKALINLLNAYYYTIGSRIVGSKFRRKAELCNDDVECLVDLAFEYEVRHVFRRVTLRPSQVREEITKFLYIVLKHEPKYVMEIGTERGGTLFLLCRASPSNATIISVDLPGGAFGGGYPKWRIPLYRSIVKRGQQLHLLRMDSHSESALRRVKYILGKNKLDLLFIDGDHRYEGVKKDFEMYSPLVGKGGIIAFHDIVPGPEENVGGVPRFWQEIKRKYNHIEIVKDWNQGGYGIGVLFI